MRDRCPLGYLLYQAWDLGLLLTCQCQLMLSADNLHIQFGPRSSLTKYWAWSGSKLFSILMMFLKINFLKVIFEKYQQTAKKHAKLPSMQSCTYICSQAEAWKPGLHHHMGLNEKFWLCCLQTTKAQTSLRICAVWSVHLLFTIWYAK